MQDNLQGALNNINEKVDNLRKLQALLHGKECCEEVIRNFKEEHNAKILARLQESTTLDRFKPTSNDDDLQAFLKDNDELALQDS